MKLPEVVQAIIVHVLENRGKFFQDVTIAPGECHLFDRLQYVWRWDASGSFSVLTMYWQISYQVYCDERYGQRCEKEVFGPEDRNIPQCIASPRNECNWHRKTILQIFC